MEMMEQERPFCFSAPSLQPLLSASTTSSPLRLFSPLCHRGLLFAEPKAGLVIVSLPAHKHLSGVCGCQET